MLTEHPAATLAAEAISKHGALQKHSELTRLVHQVQANTAHEIIVEIGSDTGGTLWLWRQLTSHVFSIDLPGGAFSSGNGDKFNGHGAVVYEGDSHTWRAREALTDWLNGQEIDFLFIDGDHTYGGARLDWDRYAPLVRKGGAVAFHDICWHGHGSTCQVDRVWQEIGGPEQGLEFISTPTYWGGIGLLYR